MDQNHSEIKVIIIIPPFWCHFRSRHLQLPENIDTFLTSQLGEFLLPCDWMYLPLVDLFNKFSAV